MTDLLKNSLDARSPHERLGIVIVGIDEFRDGLDQFRNAGEAAAPDALVSQFAKPPFDQVEPRRGRWREVQVKAEMAGKPALDFRMLMGAVVVQNQVQFHFTGEFRIQLF